MMLSAVVSRSLRRFLVVALFTPCVAVSGQEAAKPEAQAPPSTEKVLTHRPPIIIKSGSLALHFRDDETGALGGSPDRYLLAEPKIMDLEVVLLAYTPNYDCMKKQFTRVKTVSLTLRDASGHAADVVTLQVEKDQGLSVRTILRKKLELKRTDQPEWKRRWEHEGFGQGKWFRIKSIAIDNSYWETNPDNDYKLQLTIRHAK
jgi:hypothetical protein